MDSSNIIKSIRENLSIRRKDFSDALGFTLEEEKNLKKWELGELEVPSDILKRILEFPTEPPYKTSINNSKFTQIDLFAGIGGIRQGFQKHGGYTVFSSEIDKFAQTTYRLNYGELLNGDIRGICVESIPKHDVLLAGFPCQSFSIAGGRKGFEDTRGTLFFEIARILEYHKPKAFMLENVKNLKYHDKGKTLEIILNTLRDLGYYVPEPNILNAYHFGVPQNRERIIIVGFNMDYLPKNYKIFKYPKGAIELSIRVGDILEDNVPERFTISDKMYEYHIKRKEINRQKGNTFGFRVFNKNSKYTSTITARYYHDGSEALIEQKEKNKNPRMLTPRECARLQGFSDDFIIGVSNSQAYRQFGNSVCVNVIDKVAKSMIEYLEFYKIV